MTDILQNKVMLRYLNRICYYVGNIVGLFTLKSGPSVDHIKGSIFKFDNNLTLVNSQCDVVDDTIIITNFYRKDNEPTYYVYKHVMIDDEIKSGKIIYINTSKSTKENGERIARDILRLIRKK